MSTTPAPNLGNVIAPNLDWVAKLSEPALEPDLPIVDPHHHLWQRAGNDYLFHDLLADTRTGHNIVGTVFVDCHSMYRKEGPAEMRCIGETEFANGVAAMSASGIYGNLRACAGIVSHVDLRRGAKAGAVFDAQIAAGNGRFKGIRYQTGWDADPGIRNSRTDPTPGRRIVTARAAIAAKAGGRSIAVRTKGASGLSEVAGVRPGGSQAARRVSPRRPQPPGCCSGPPRGTRVLLSPL